jgi:glutamate synthase domain-containing protein 2
MKIGKEDMPLDIVPHIEVMCVTLLAIGEWLRRRLKQKRLVKLVLTVEDTESNTSDSKHPRMKFGALSKKAHAATRKAMK